MALLSNVPTLSYIRWQNLLITYQGITYQISNNQTNKAYIYWDVGNPTELIASSRKLEEKSGQFYIFFNEKGRYTVVPNDEIEINFSEGGAREAMTDTIIGFGQKIDANNQRFSTIEADIDGLKTTVGEIQNNGGGSSSTISKIEQRVDEIELEVEHIEKIFNEEQLMDDLRDNVNSSILSLQSTLGLFSSDMNTIMSDNKLSSEETTQISSYTSSLSSSLSSVASQIDLVISHFQEQDDTEKVTRLTTAKNNLTNAIQNLTNGINTAGTDNIFTNSEVTTITSYFGEANTSINEIKNLIDDYIFLGVGGDLIEEISRITLRQDEINLNVSRNEQTVSEDLSNLKQRVDETELKITDDAIISTVSSTFYNKTQIDNFIKDIPGGSDVLELEEIKNTVSQHETSINSITSRVSTIETKTTTLDGNFVSLEERVDTAEQKITDDAIVNTVVSSKKWLNATGGENYISNPTANINVNGWKSINDSYIMRYTGIESSIPLPNIIPPNVGHDLYQPVLHCIEPLGEGIGLSLLIIDCTGKTIFIDGGYVENSTHCINYLTTLGVAKLDYHIITHAHSDHIETGIDVLNSFGTSKTKVLITTLDKAKLPVVESTWNTTALYDEYMSTCEAKGVQILNPRSNTYIKLSNHSSLTLFNTDNKDFSNYNNQSLGCLYQYKDNKILLMGDITSTAESCVIGQVGKVDILQAGHHGLKDASTLKLLDELSPKHTVISTNDLAVNGDNAHAMETVRKISYLGCGVCYGFGGSINNLYNNDFTFTLTGTSVTTTGKNCIAKNTWFEKSPGEWYWFKADGELAKNETLTINGTSKEFDDNGVCLNP